MSEKTGQPVAPGAEAAQSHANRAEPHADPAEPVEARPGGAATQAELVDSDTVFRRELEVIRDRRALRTASGGLVRVEEPPRSPGEEESGETVTPWPAEDLGLVGLALSGGGIRSACFNLGLLQALGNKCLLSRVDYLSTVSGGGYIGSCLSALLADEVAKAAELKRGERKDERAEREEKEGAVPFSFDGENENPVIKHLRRHGDYLAVRHGLLHLDVWRLVSAYLGGLLLSFGTVLLLIAAVASSGVALWQGLFFLWQWRFGWGAPPKAALADAGRFLWEPSLYTGTILTPTLIALAAWALMGFVYVAVKLKPAAWTIGFRRRVGKIQGFLLGLTAALAVAAAIPFLFVAATGALDSLGAVLASAGVASSLSLAGLARLGERVGKAASKLERFKRGAIATAAFVLVVVACLGVLYVVWLEHEWLLHIALGSVAALLALGMFGDINRISMFHFYRDRLSEAFVLQRRAAQQAPPGASAYRVENADGLLLASLAEKLRAPVPYHLINACVNLPGSSVPEIRDRKADFFLLSPLFCGSETTGYVTTSTDAVKAPRLAWAMAVSGAAANPQLGTRSSPALTFLLAMLNARLGVWVRNPAKRPVRPFEESYRPVLWPYHLLRELISDVDEGQPLVNLSDGGHIENLGVYELLKRRCRTIICSDASADPDSAFEDLGNLIRKARIDLGVRIEVELDEIRRGLKHAVAGTISYPEKGGGGEKVHRGVFVYVKPTLSPGVPPDLLEYHTSHQTFPHETTVDQFFDEAQFESYRELGYQSGKAVAKMWQPACG